MRDTHNCSGMINYRQQSDICCSKTVGIIIIIIPKTLVVQATDVQELIHFTLEINTPFIIFRNHGAVYILYVHVYV